MNLRCDGAAQTTSVTLTTHRSHDQPHGHVELALQGLERLAPALVGANRVTEVQDRLTKGMLMEALRRTSANYARAAQLLGVRRQAIQQMVVRFELSMWASSLRSQRCSVAIGSACSPRDLSLPRAIPRTPPRAAK